MIRSGRKFSELELIELADRLLSILIYLHERDPAVIHRNLSPNTILLVERLDIKSPGYLDRTPTIDKLRKNRISFKFS